MTGTKRAGTPCGRAERELDDTDETAGQDTPLSRENVPNWA
ncbi:hypothetical protein ACLK1T_27200 [Escherichia coli]